MSHRGLHRAPPRRGPWSDLDLPGWRPGGRLRGLDGFVDDLFVRPRHRRKGLGRAALGALFEECHRRNVFAVHVEVGRGNAAARALYEALGLRPRDDDRQVLTVRR